MVNRSCDLVSTVISPLFFLLLAAGSVSAAEGDFIDASAEPEPQLLVEPSIPPMDEERQVDVLEQKGGVLGYSFVFADDNGGRAQEYSWLHSSQSGGLFYRRMEKDSNLELDGTT